MYPMVTVCDLLDAPTALAACCGFDLCRKCILYLYLYLYLHCSLVFCFWCPLLLLLLCDAPTALAACCGFDLCHKYIWYLVFGILYFCVPGTRTSACVLWLCGCGALTPVLPLLCSGAQRAQPAHRSRVQGARRGDARDHRLAHLAHGCGAARTCFGAVLRALI